MTEHREFQPLIRRRRLTRWLKRLAVVTTLLLAAAAAILVWAFRTGRAAEFVRKEILTELKDRCAVDAEFTDLKLDPLARDVTLTDLVIRDEDGRRRMAVTSAQVAVALWPMLYGRFQLERVALLAPEANIRVRNGEIVDLPACVTPAAEAQGTPTNFGVTELVVERGRFALEVDDMVSAQLDDIGVVLTARRGGGTEIAIGVDDTNVIVKGRPVTMERFRLTGRLEGLLSRPRAIFVDSLDVAVGAIRVGGQAHVDLLGPVYDAKLTVAAPLQVINEYVESAPALSGAAELDVSFAGASMWPRASGQLVVTKGRVDEFKLGDRARIGFSVDQEGVQLRPAEVELADGRVVVEGRLAFNDPLSVYLDARIRRVALARILDAVGVRHVLADFMGTGRATLRGKLKPFELSGPLDIKVRDVLVGDRAWDDPRRIGKAAAELEPGQRMLWIPQGRVAGQWRFDEDGLAFQQMQITTGTTAGEANAYLPFAKEGRMSVTGEFPTFDFEDVGPIAEVPFAGRGKMTASLGGPYDKVQGTGRLQLAGTSIGSTAIGNVEARVRWYDDRRLDFTAATAVLGESRFSGRVGVLIDGDVPLDISGRISPGRIEDMFTPFGTNPAEWGAASGVMDATVDVQGPVDRLTGPVEVRLGAGAIYGERWQRGRAVVRFEAGKIVIDGLELAKYGGRVLATGAFDPSRGGLRLVARTRGAKVQSIDLIRGSQERLTGDLVARAQIDGSVHGLTGTVSVGLSDVRAGPLDLGRGRIYGRLHGATLSLTAEALEGSAALEGDLMLKPGLPYSAQINLKNVDVPAIVSGLKGNREWRGNVTMQAGLSGRLNDWGESSGRLKVQEARLETPRFTLGTTAVAQLKLDRGVLESDRVLVGGPRSQLSVRGRLGTEVVDLRVGGKVDLAVAELIGSSIEKAGGELKIDASVGGTPEVLNLVGAGRIEGGMLKWRGLEDRITAFAADLTFSQSSVLIDRSTGRFAGGRLGMTGSILLERFFPKNVALRVALQQAQPRFQTRTVDLTGVLSGQLTVNGAFERMLVRGELNVDRGRAEPKIEWTSLVGTRGLAAVYDPSNEIIDFDILVRGGEQGFRIKNRDADINLNGEFRLTGTNERMGMLGTLPVSQGGRVVFLGREYIFQAGTLNLTERYRFAPRYDLRMTSESCDAAITIVLVGTLDTFEMTYRSNPEMDQRDIVSCLIRGVRISELDQDLASFAGSALLKLSGVDQEVKKVLLIDQIEVTTEYSSVARAYEPRVLVAKNLSVLDRPARLEFSTSLLRTNDQRAAVRVRLTPQLNLQLGWTSSEDVPFGDWGLDLKQRWEW